MRASAALISSLIAATALAQEPPASPPAPPASGPSGRAAAPAPPAAPPKPDYGRAVAEAVARILATPRFEEQVEVRDTYQEALGRYFAEAELTCGTTESGPPPEDELNRFRAHPVPPHADLLAGFKWLHQKVRGLDSRKKPRYFLYQVHLESAPERFVYVVNEGALSESDRASAPGTEWELLAGYADASKATEALTKLQRRMSAPSAPEQTRGLALWAARRCPE
jgi:hypothetical protein